MNTSILIPGMATGSIKLCNHKNVGKQPDGRTNWPAIPTYWPIVTGEPVKVPKTK